MLDGNRGSSKLCIERNTFPHKYQKFHRQKKEGEDDDEPERCTICLCGKLTKTK